MAEAFEVKATARYIQISPQKARLIVNAVRGMNADKAMNMLRFTPQKAAEPVYKLIESAVATRNRTMVWKRANCMYIGYMLMMVPGDAWLPTVGALAVAAVSSQSLSVRRISL